MNDQSAPVWDVGDFLKALRHHRLVIVGVVILVTAIAAGFSYSHPPVYVSTAKVVVTPTQLQPTQQVDPNKISAVTETSLARSVAVASVAKQLMHSQRTVQELLGHVSASMTQGSQILSISFSASKPSAAQQGASAFSAAYLQYRQQSAGASIDATARSYEDQLQLLNAQIDSLVSRLRSLPPGSNLASSLQIKLQSLGGAKAQLQSQIIGLQATPAGGGQLIDPASLPSKPASPNHQIDLAFGVVIGLLVGAVVAVAKEWKRHAVRSSEELEDHLGSPVLALIPRIRRTDQRDALVVTRGGGNAAAIAYRRLRISFLNMAERNNWKTFLITSAEDPDAKSMTVANLGAALSEIGKKVVLVSADVHAATLDEMFRTNGDPGLIQVLSEATVPSQVIQDSTIPNLRLVPTGPGPRDDRPMNLLQGQHMKELLLECRRGADFVLIDSPPILRDPDTLELARLADGVLLVARAGSTSSEDLDSSLHELRRAGASIIGGVLDATDVHWKHGMNGSARLKVKGVEHGTSIEQDLTSR